GQAVAAAALRHYPQTQRFVILCGPGNNGGDGYVAARALASTGSAVTVHTLGDPEKLSGDARRAFDLCPVRPEPLQRVEPRAGDTVIDAIFGAGLARAVPEDVRQAFARMENSGVPLSAVDLPPGLCGRSGAVLGAAFRADHTVTFMARKPGHILMPGRSLCGDMEIFDIGIPHRIVKAAAGTIRLNHPILWEHLLPSPDAASHKYRRGHLAVFSGGASHTGAARLSASAGLAAGAGLVTLVSPGDAMAINAGQLTAVMLREIETVGALEDWLSDARLSAFVL